MKELKEKLLAALKAARDICDKVDQEKRDFSPEERQKVTGYLDEAGRLKALIKAKEGDEELRKTILEMGAGVSLGDGQQQQRQSPVAGGTKGATIGERFINSDAWQAWYKTVAPSGSIPESSKGLHSPPIEFKGMGLFGQKDLITGANDASAGAFVQTDYTGIYEPLGRRPLTVRDLISIRTTTSDLVEFVRQTMHADDAKPVPEANIKVYTGATGEISGEKPQTALYWEKVQEAVKTIAVWVAATKRALSDAGQLRGIIDQELREDIQEEFEDQILTGDGVGENFLGLANQPGVLLQAFGANLLATCRQAKTTLRTVGRTIPTAWLFNPADWETVELSQDLVNQYYGGGPFGATPPRLWGVPVVESEAWPQGTAVLANWRKMVVWDREQYSLSVTDSHADFFIRNIIAFLSEMRAAMGLIRPSAFIITSLA